MGYNPRPAFAELDKYVQAGRYGRCRGSIHINSTVIFFVFSYCHLFKKYITHEHCCSLVIQAMTLNLLSPILDTRGEFNSLCVKLDYSTQWYCIGAPYEGLHSSIRHSLIIHVNQHSPVTSPIGHFWNNICFASAVLCSELCPRILSVNLRFRYLSDFFRQYTVVCIRSDRCYSFNACLLALMALRFSCVSWNHVSFVGPSTSLATRRWISVCSPICSCKVAFQCY
jgi:hypothetical protein